MQFRKLVFICVILTLYIIHLDNFGFGTLDIRMVIAKFTASKLEFLKKLTCFGVFKLSHCGSFVCEWAFFYIADWNTVLVHFLLDLLSNRCCLGKICIKNFIVRREFFRTIIGPVDVCASCLTYDVSSIVRYIHVGLVSLIIGEIWSLTRPIVKLIWAWADVKCRIALPIKVYLFFLVALHKDAVCDWISC